MMFIKVQRFCTMPGVTFVRSLIDDAFDVVKCDSLCDALTFAFQLAERYQIDRVIVDV